MCCESMWQVVSSISWHIVQFLNLACCTIIVQHKCYGSVISLTDEQNRTQLTIRGSTSIAMTFLTCSKSFIVKFPVPGPISRTVSVVFSPDFSTIAWTTIGFFRICWPLLRWNSMPANQRMSRTVWKSKERHWIKSEVNRHCNPYCSMVIKLLSGLARYHEHWALPEALFVPLANFLTVRFPTPPATRNPLMPMILAIKASCFSPSS